MRLIDADETISELKRLPEQERLEYMGVYDLLKSVPTVDAKPISKKFARFITKAIASYLNELQLDLPATVYEDIEYTLMKGNFTNVETFVRNYVQNNYDAKMDEEV